MPVKKIKKEEGHKDSLKLSVNAEKVLKKRYLLKDEKGVIIETPSQMFGRVAKAVAQVESRYREDVKKTEEEFYRAMASLEFLPNTPTLMNAGTKLGQLSACFVLPVEDSLDSIFTAVKQMAIIHQSGGGTGFSFSHLRPRGDIVKSTKGVASGPVSFMRVFDTTTEVIKQGGKRRGANMGILTVNHPDILEFIGAKNNEGVLPNFNLSVAVTDEFMDAVDKHEKIKLINPHTKKSVKELPARDLWELIITNAWKTGDPGLIFIDEINRRQPTPKLGKIESTNPCGEVPLLPYESCNLGSINLSKMVHDGRIDWDRIRATVGTGVRFLDNVIDANHFPFPEIEGITKKNRKIGLGVMGWAEFLIQLGLPYNSDRAVKLAEGVMKFINQEAIKASEELASKRGAFPAFKQSIWAKGTPMRNATVTTIAPTGTISIIAGCSSGIEPLFAVSYIRNVMEGTQLIEVSPVFDDLAKKRGFYSMGLISKIAKTGSVHGMHEVPKDVQHIFVTALDIAHEWHIKMQAAFQKHTHNAVSKTINLPSSATIHDVDHAYKLAHRLGCKGVTVYRYGSKQEQVLYIGPLLGKQGGASEYVGADSEFAGGCPSPVCPH